MVFEKQFKFSVQSTDNTYKAPIVARITCNEKVWRIGCHGEKNREMGEMNGIHCWELENGEQQTAGSQEEVALAPAAAFIPKVEISDRYTGRYRWTGPEALWVAAGPG